MYQNLREQLENVAKTAGKTEYQRVMADYEEYGDLVLEAEQLVVGLSSRLERIKDRGMDFKLKGGSMKVNIDLEQKMLEIEQQKAEIEHRKLQIEVERLNPEKEKLRKKLEVGLTTTPWKDTKPNNVSVKLLHLDFKKFTVELLKWKKFWDSFHSAIHSNPSLIPVESMNYLRADWRESPQT